jgi:hypothetical protein
MNRKLRNSLTALSTCSLAFILVIVGTSPLISLDTRASASPTGSRPALGAPASIEAGLDPRMQATSEQPAPSPTRRRRDNRQPLVMPYVSFAPRG